MQSKYYMQNKLGQVQITYFESDNEAFEYAQRLNRKSTENWKAYDCRGNLIYYVISHKR